YSADIDWGDNAGTQKGAGAITLRKDGTFEVRASHTYVDEDGVKGSIQVDIHHERSKQQTVQVSLTVTDPSVTAKAIDGSSFTAKEGTASSIQTLATFTDPGGPDSSGDYSADVDWGNGTFVAGDANVSIVGPDKGGVFTVTGSHTYTAKDVLTGGVQIRILHEGPT